MSFKMLKPANSEMNSGKSEAANMQSGRSSGEHRGHKVNKRKSEKIDLCYNKGVKCLAEYREMLSDPSSSVGSPTCLESLLLGTFYPPSVQSPFRKSSILYLIRWCGVTLYKEL